MTPMIVEAFQAFAYADGLLNIIGIFHSGHKI